VAVAIVAVAALWVYLRFGVGPNVESKDDAAYTARTGKEPPPHQSNLVTTLTMLTLIGGAFALCSLAGLGGELMQAVKGP